MTIIDIIMCLVSTDACLTRDSCCRRQDKDGKLTRLEFSTFLHPEEAEHMRDVVVTETIEDIDADGDGKISIDEYIGERLVGWRSVSDIIEAEIEHSNFLLL